MAEFSDAPRKRAFAKLDWLAEVMQGAKRVAGRRLRPHCSPGNTQQINKNLTSADMAELADAYGSGPYESDFMQVRPLLSAPRRSKGKLCSVFLCSKNIRPLPCSSFFTKSHARLVCSVVNAFTTTRCRYQLFVSFVLP